MSARAHRIFATTTADNFNTIDPSLVTDASGGKWLVLGSFWGSIKLTSLDPATGKSATSSPTVYSIASKPSPDAEEGAGITYRDWYDGDAWCRSIPSAGWAAGR
jgi:arabinan endo-1,5-alpha-L-arabinosidase